jgi:L-amino acid N-acyltransferase
LIIRAACAADAQAICDIANPLIRDTLFSFTTCEKTSDEVEAAISSNPGQFLVAEELGLILGYASFAQFREGPGYAHTAEHTIYLAPDAQGRGIGRALMAQVEIQAVECGVHALIAGISSANPDAIAFHAALGFDEVGRLPEAGWKADMWLDLILMQKILPAATQQGADMPERTR